MIGGQHVLYQLNEMHVADGFALVESGAEALLMETLTLGTMENIVKARAAESELVVCVRRLLAGESTPVVG